MLRVTFKLWLWTMLSTNYRLELIDICCRIVSTDGKVSLEERIWLHKLCENNKHAKEIAESLLSQIK